MFLFLLVLPASAQKAPPEPRDPLIKFQIDDLLSLKYDRYLQGRMHSRFPVRDRKLSLLPPAQRSLDVVYSRERAFCYTIQPGDTLARIAKKFGTTLQVVRLMNRINGNLIFPGKKLWVPDRSFILEIDKGRNKLYLRTGNELVKEYLVSTGKSETQTPPGVFLIESRYPYPTWFHKGEVVAGGSPDNYLGSRWLGFDKPQFGLHGTTFPELIGQPVSKGCVRMKNEDVEELYEFIPVGTLVIITG